MSSKLNIIATVLILVIGLYSCGEEEYTGEALTNYPDFEQILENEWDMDSSMTYWKVSRTKSSVDSILLESSNMPWQEIKDIFKNGNIQKNDLDQHYAIDILKDSIRQTVTLYYKSVVPKDYTKSISIVSDVINGTMNSLYFETNEKAGASDSKRVLFVPNKLLQIQNRKKEDTQVETYFFSE